MKKKLNPPTVYDCIRACILEVRRASPIGQSPSRAFVSREFLHLAQEYCGHHHAMMIHDPSIKLEDGVAMEWMGVKLVVRNAPGIWCAVRL